MRSATPVFLVAALAHGCTNGSGEARLPPEIDDILERRCRMCHSNPMRMFAPMPLVTWEDAHALRSEKTGELVFEAIGRRIHDAKFPMPPLPNPSLSDEDKAAWPKLSREETDTLDAWIADNAPPAE